VQRFVAAQDGCDGKYGCGGQYPFTIAVCGMTIGIIVRARRWSYCRSSWHRFWHGIAVLSAAVALAARGKR
jgi:hypothetical protein